MASQSGSWRGVTTMATLMLLSACATDNVFSSRFGACVAALDATERGPQMTVFPKGQSKQDYCYHFARSTALRLP